MSDDKNNVVDFPKPPKLAEILDNVHNAQQLEQIDTDLFFDDAKLNEMNEKYAFICNYGGKSVVMEWVFDAVHGRKIISMRTPESILMQWSNQTAQIDTKILELGKYWLKHSGRREYQSVFFDPALPREHNKCFNLYNGMAVTPKKGSWKRTRRHIWYVLCNQDPEKFKYVIRWLAWCVQNPGRPAEVAVVFKGQKGAGKGFIFSQMVKIYGEHGMSISNRKHLTGNFNGHLANLVFLFADEAYNPGDREVEGVLKQLVTEATIPIEAKFKGASTGKNCLHIGMASNEEWVVPVSNDERRFFINAVDNAYAKGAIDDHIRVDYFNKLWGEMNNGGREAMLHDLLAVKLGNWHPREYVPMSMEMEHQKFLSAPRTDKALLMMIDEGVFPGVKRKIEGFEGEEDPVWFEVKGAVLNEYLERLYPEHKRVGTVAFAKTLDKFGIKKHRNSKGNVWRFPELSVMKARWLKQNFHFVFDTKEEWTIEGHDF